MRPRSPGAGGHRLRRLSTAISSLLDSVPYLQWTKSLGSGGRGHRGTSPPPVATSPAHSAPRSRAEPGEMGE